MSYKKIVTIQDVSCVGQCSLTVALPIISACGVETCILPSAVLSTHTGGFTGFTFRDLTEDMPLISQHWQKENIKFDAVYTGYLGSTRQIEYVKNIIEANAADGAAVIIDPAMADNGKLYVGFDDAFVNEMKTLCGRADILLPNITEASFLTGMEYKETYDEEYVETLIKKLCELGAQSVIMTGVSYNPDTTGVCVYAGGEFRYYEHERISTGCHGTGDVYASAFVGALMNGKNCYEAAVIAADYTVECIRVTVGDKDHWYGVKFEKALPKLMRDINVEGI